MKPANIPAEMAEAFADSERAELDAFVRMPAPKVDKTAELLHRAAEKANARRFTAEPITGFGALA